MELIGDCGKVIDHSVSPYIQEARSTKIGCFSSAAIHLLFLECGYLFHNMNPASRIGSNGSVNPNNKNLNDEAQKPHEVSQIKQGLYSDVPVTRVSEMMKSKNLNNAPTQSLMGLIYEILDESGEGKSTEITQRVACLLRKVLQEVERRISTQAEHLRTQSNHFKNREEKYQSRIRVLEALATQTSEDSEVVMKKLHHMKSEKMKLVEKNNSEEEKLEISRKAYGLHYLETEQKRSNIDEEVAQLKKQNDQINGEIAELKQELETYRNTDEQNFQESEPKKNDENEGLAQMKNEEDQLDSEISALQQELETVKRTYEQRCIDLEQRNSIAEEEISGLMKEKEQCNLDISTLKQALEMSKKTHELRCLELETETKMATSILEHKLNVQEHHIQDLKNKIKETEANAALKCKEQIRKDNVFKGFINNQSAALKELRISSQSMKLEHVKARYNYLQELSCIGGKFQELVVTAQKYHEVLYENRKIYNELQDLKGNIRVYCRIRPFLPGEIRNDTVVESIGEDGELVIVNPLKGSDSQKKFKFNKVYAQSAIQDDVFSDTQPLIRTVLDGYNVCIFAYGQTGSGKTYTMIGPETACKDDWGVNYRALDDLFRISEERKNNFAYEIGVQMIEIYNEQILDLLSSDNAMKKLGVLNGSQANGISVPDASMHLVQSTSDVIELMSFGYANRSVGSTAMNERSSRSHSVTTVHVQGTDLKSGATTYASLHLVDLAGSERVDRSEAIGDRLREAQYINKSLSALGDVIFALASKSNHIPYRNSKLTQVLQSSLGGRAKTLMFVQVNPDASSYSETVSTLKFAERVSGVELGAARSNKEGRDTKGQVATVHSRRHSTNSLPYYGSQFSPTSSVATDQEDFADRISDSGSTQFTDYDEILSEVSDGTDFSLGTDADSVSETKDTSKGSKQLKIPDGSSDKARSSRLVSPRFKVPGATNPSRLSQVKTNVRATPALRKSLSGTISPRTQPTGATSSPRTQPAGATSSPRTPSRRWV